MGLRCSGHVEPETCSARFAYADLLAVFVWRVDVLSPGCLWWVWGDAEVMRYGSVCSGIEAASVAWASFGWHASFLSEIEAFPRAVLQHHYPEAPLHGDFTSIGADDYGPIDLLVGGTPCQSFSVAGLRGGLADKRGNLALEYLRLADRKKPRWVLWENVPGVLSSGEGRDFGSFLGGLGELGYGFAYRVLDAKHFGVPQQRRRVFVVGYLGDWRRAAAVLFEPESMSGISPKNEKDHVSDVDWWSGKNRFLNCIDAGYGRKWGSNQWYARGHVIIGSDGRPRRATPLEVERAFGFPDGYTAIPASALRQVRRGQTAKPIPQTAKGAARAPFVVQGVRECSPEGFSGKERKADGQTRLEPIHPLQIDGRDGPDDEKSPGRPVRHMPQTDGSHGDRPLSCDEGSPGTSLPSVQHKTSNSGRRSFRYGSEEILGPIAADGPRYKALGNSMAVPVMRWIGQRIGQQT